MPHSAPVLGIVAGGGRLPAILAESCENSGRPYFVALLEGQAAAQSFAGRKAETFRLGAVGRLIKALRRQGVEEIVLAGSVRRPRLAELMPDLWTARFLSRTRAFSRGDDGLLRAIVGVLENDEGFRVIGPDDIAPDLLTPLGVIANVPVSPRLAGLIEPGIAAARSLGRRDQGQAVVIGPDGAICEEGPEGTEALLRDLPAAFKGGVLVKMTKPDQERRVDLPAMGPDTVDQAEKAGLCGLVVEAGGSLLLDRGDMIARADAAGLFLLGAAGDGPARA